MSYVRYVCVFAYSSIQHVLWCVFALFFFVLCTLNYVASFSGLSIFLSFGILLRLYNSMDNIGQLHMIVLHVFN